MVLCYIKAEKICSSIRDVRTVMEDIQAKTIRGGEENPGTTAENSHFSRPRRMLQTNASVASKLQLVLDIVLVDALLYLIAYLKGIHDFSIYHFPAIVTPVLMWLIYSNSGVYRRFSGNMSRSAAVMWAWAKVAAMLIVLAFLVKASEAYSRQVIITWICVSAIMQSVVHTVMESVIRTYKAKYVQPIPSLMVGNSRMGGYLAAHINRNPWIAHKIVGVISDDDGSEEQTWHFSGLPKLGDLDDLRSMVEKYEVKRVYFALPMKTSHQVRELQMQLIDLNVDIVWAPDIFGLHMTSPSVREVAGVPLYYLSESPLVEGARVSKLIMDKVLASVALVLLAPVMIGAAIAVKFSSPGPVFFRQERHGLDGKIIGVLKFRSMKVHQESEGVVKQATKHDARVTPVGAFLRKSSIDELPQLFNVLKGEMSLVGPRPHAREHNHYYADKIVAYMSRHRILPGMTGLAQVNGYRGETDTLEKMEKRVEYDLAYINNWSIWLDIRIMIKTVFTLLSKNAY